MDVSEIKEQLKSAFKNFITNKVENEKWITIHPHGDESEDYRRLKLEDGESPKEAIDRVYKKEDKTPKDKRNSEGVKRFENGNKVGGYGKFGNKYRAVLGHYDSNKQFVSDTLGADGAEFDTEEDAQKYIKEKLGIQSDTKEDGNETEILKDIKKNGFDIVESKEGFNIADKTGQKLYVSDIKEYPDFVKKVEEDYIYNPNKSEKQSDTKEESKSEEDKSIDKYLTDKSDKGWLYETKGTSTYSNNGKSAEVEEFGKDGGKYRVVFYDDNKRKDIKVYSTKRGMEKAIREHLQGGPNKETKALETKSNLEEKENTYKEVLQRYNENDRKRWSSGLSNEEYHKAWTEAEKAKKELTTARREYAESIMANFEKSDNTYYEDKQNARRERYEELSEKASRESEQAHQAFRDKMSAIPFGQPILVGHHSEQRDRRYREKAWDTLGKAVKLSDKADYYESKANSVGKAGISADDANAIAKLAQKYKSGVTSAEKRRIIDRVIDIHKNRQMAGDTSKQTDYSNLGFQVERNTDINRLQLKFDGKPEANVRSILKSNGFRWSPREGAWQRQLGGNSEGGLNRVVEQLKNINNSLLMGLDEILQQEPITTQDSKIINCINNILDPVINNSKEQDMALIEELKKLITKVENTKGEEEMEIENEKVDKRKLIDEVGGILKGKVDDEVIRTIIGKMEKMSYDNSEASADNKKVKNEADEEDKKVDNEEDEKEDKKVDNEDEEDEEKVEELKKEEKKDVDNKCKNSKEENYFDKLNKIYNSAKKIEEPSADYESKQARLEAGKEYFG